MYTIHERLGTVTRDSDGVQVAPAQGVDDKHYAEYVAWVEAGNTPAIDDSVPAMPRSMSAADFRSRFTDSELASIVRLAYSGEDMNAAMLLLKVQTTSTVDIDSQDVLNGLAYLTAKGCLAAGRAAEITG